MRRINVAVFCAVLAAFVVIATAFSRDGRTIERENRSFNEFPEISSGSIFSGKFAEDIEPWLSDRVVRRADFVAASMAITESYGVDAPIPEETAAAPAPSDTTMPTPSPAPPSEPSPTPRPTPPDTPRPTPYDRPRPTASPAPSDAQEPVLSGSPVPAPSDTSDSTQEPEPSGGDGPVPAPSTPDEQDGAYTSPPAHPPYSAQPEGVGRVKGPILVFDDRLVEIFGYSKRSSERYAGVINGYRESLPDSVRVFSLLTPTQIEFVPEAYRDVSDSELDAITTAYGALTEGVISVDAYGEIAEHTGEYLYFRTDHHWTALGAYYAYRAYAAAAGFEPKELSEYEEIAIPGFLGYLYNMAPSQSLRENPDTIYCYRYKGELETSSKLLYLSGANGKATYSVFLGGDHPQLTVTTSVKNGKTAVIIKDSFGNAFIPWLAPHYENLVVLDPRHFEGSALDVIAGYESADLIFLDYAITTSFGDFITAIEGIK
jgi:hypothetical protein